MIPLNPSIDPMNISANGPTCFMTERNEHKVRCGMCGKSMYLDDETYQSGREAIDSGLDNPFRCEICAEEYDDLAYEG